MKKVLKEIYNDKSAMCRIFNIVTGEKFKSRDLIFESRRNKYHGYWIRVLCKNFNRCRDTIHIQIDEDVQVSIDLLSSGTHYCNNWKLDHNKLAKFLSKKGWIDNYKRRKEIERYRLLAHGLQMFNNKL